MDIIIACGLFVIALLAITGRPLNINITTTHKAEVSNTEAPAPKIPQEDTEDDKELATLLQDIMGVTDEE